MCVNDSSVVQQEKRHSVSVAVMARKLQRCVAVLITLIDIPAVVQHTFELREISTLVELEATRRNMVQPAREGGAAKTEPHTELEPCM